MSSTKSPIPVHSALEPHLSEISPQKPRDTYITSPPESFGMSQDDTVCEQAAKQVIFQQKEEKVCLQEIQEYHVSVAHALHETFRPLLQMLRPLRLQLAHWERELQRALADSNTIRKENAYKFRSKWDTSNISFLLILFLLFAAIQSMVFGVIGVQSTLVTNVVAFMDNPIQALIWSMIFVVFPFIYKGAYASEMDERKKQRFVTFFLTLFTISLGVFLFTFAYQYAPDPSDGSLNLGLVSTDDESSGFAGMVPILGLLSQLVLELTGSVLTLIYYQKLEEKYRKKKIVRNKENSSLLHIKNREILQIQQLIFVLRKDIGSIESMSIQFEHEKKALLTAAENSFFYFLRAL